MKFFLTALISLLFSVANAQFNHGTVYLKDSTKLVGLIKIKSLGGGIKFKPSNDAKSTLYNFETITGFDTKDEKYRYIKSQEGYNPILLKEKIKGKISLYSNEIYNPGHTIPTGFAGGGAPMSFGGGTSTIFYILVENKLHRVGIKLNKKHLEILKDCESLTEKIATKYYKKRNVYDIIYYYNNSCN